jgi:hypothetical protein
MAGGFADPFCTLLSSTSSEVVLGEDAGAFPLELRAEGARAGSADGARDEAAMITSAIVVNRAAWT